MKTKTSRQIREIKLKGDTRNKSSMYYVRHLAGRARNN